MNRAHDETSRALLTAAHRLLATEGPDALTVRRIATEAGMSTMNVYSRFGGKDGVLDELYADGFRRLFDEIENVPDTDAVVDDLLTVASAYRQFAVDNPQYYGIMFGEFTPSSRAFQAGLRGFDSYANRLTRALERGAIELPDGLDPHSATVWLWGACHGMVSLELTMQAGSSVDWPHVYRTGMRAVLGGLAVTAPVRPVG